MYLLLLNILLKRFLKQRCGKMVELQRWKTNEVCEEVTYENQKCISVKRVCGMKSCENGYIYPKARLVARGLENDNQNLNKESPKCSKDSFRS